LTEYVTPVFQRFVDQFPEACGSEYLGPGYQPGEVVDGVPHEDLQALSFADEAFDVILSFDVLEHVPDETEAFAEMARCLRPGGTLLMTAPTQIHQYDNEVRAILSPTGELTHLKEPEYHGNPVDEEGGSLCYRYYGWQVLDQLRSAGFSDAVIMTYWSERFMYLGEPQMAVLATR
jgi:SAM-dependent methyltransferase